MSYRGAFDIVVDCVGVVLAAQQAEPAGFVFVLLRAPFSVDSTPASVGNSGCYQFVEAPEVGNAFLSVDSGPSRKVPLAQDLSDAFERVVGGASANRSCDIVSGAFFPLVVVFLC